MALALARAAAALLLVVVLALLLSWPCLRSRMRRAHSNSSPAEPAAISNALPNPPRNSSSADQRHEEGSGSPRFFLVTSFGGSYSEERRAELVGAILHNAGLLPVAALHVLTEQPAAGHPLQDLHPKVQLVPTRGQPTYADLLVHLNRLVAAPASSEGAEGSFGVVMNADMELDGGSLRCIRSAPIVQRHNRLLYALTRHPHPSCKRASGGGVDPRLPTKLGLDRRRDGSYTNSADAFLLHGPAPVSVVRLSNHTQNRLGSENRLLYFFKLAGYALENPCAQIRVYHRHCVRERTAGALQGAARVDVGGMKALLPRTSLACDPDAG